MYIAVSLDEFQIYPMMLSHLSGEIILIGDLVLDLLEFYKYRDFIRLSFTELLSHEHNRDDDIHFQQWLGGFEDHFTIELETIFNMRMSNIMETMRLSIHTIVGDTMILTNE